MGKKSSCMLLNRGDIVLVPFPFTDLTSSKVRPAVIVSANPQGEDVIIGFISSVVPKVLGKAEFLLTSDHPDFAPTGLKRNSVFKMSKLLTISVVLILRRLGKLSPALQKELDVLLKRALGIS